MLTKLTLKTVTKRSNEFIVSELDPKIRPLIG